MTDIIEPQVLTAAEVAAKLRHCGKWFRRRRRELEANGFPPPLPCTHGRLWSRAAVERWIAGDTEKATADAEAKAREILLRTRSEQIAAEISRK